VTGSLRQRTIRRPVSVSGQGIHSGEDAEVTLGPGPIFSGIVFRRLDRADASPVRATLSTVTDTRRGITLGQGSSTVRTVEHLVAAAAGLGVSNLTVSLRGEEVPVLDGSAGPFCALLDDAGIEEQDAAIEPIMPSGPVWVAAGGASILALPASALRITYVVPLGHPVLGAALTADVTFAPGVFARDVAPARTWGFTAEVEALRAQGLARGATAENALGVGPNGYLSPPRMADEPARHKILDLVGDLALLGRPLRAHVIAMGAGHALHVDLARRIVRG